MHHVKYNFATTTIYIITYFTIHWDNKLYIAKDCFHIDLTPILYLFLYRSQPITLTSFRKKGHNPTTLTLIPRHILLLKYMYKLILLVKVSYLNTNWYYNTYCTYAHNCNNIGLFFFFLEKTIILIRTRKHESNI